MAEVAIAEVTDYLKRRLGEAGVRVERLVLFGSRAQDRADAQSDIDLAVVSSDFRGKDIFERVELTRVAEMDTVFKFHVPLDLILMTPEELASRSSPVAAVAREGKDV